MPRHAHDYHVHSNYSDGEFLWKMARAADRAGLDGVGVADHCAVSEAAHRRRRRAAMGFNLDVTYERRREAIAALNERDDLDATVFDGVEMDYHPDDEAAIRSFLADAGFEYAVGSVHELDGVNVHWAGYFAEMDASTRRDHVDTYFDRLVALVDSELFDVAAHLDLVERNEALRGLATRDHYDRVAEALVDSRTVPEVNAGRVDRAYGEFHPAPAFVDALRDHDVRFVVGSDAHDPDELERRTPLLEERFDAMDVDPIEVL